MLVSHLVLLLKAVLADLQCDLAKACRHVCNLPSLHTQQQTYRVMIRHTSNYIKAQGLDQ